MADRGWDKRKEGLSLSTRGVCTGVRDWGGTGEVRRIDGIERWNHLLFWYVTAKRQLFGLVLGLFHPPGSNVSCLYFYLSVCP